jgi:hypothetical protein
MSEHHSDIVIAICEIQEQLDIITQLVSTQKSDLAAANARIAVLEDVIGCVIHGFQMYVDAHPEIDTTDIQEIIETIREYTGIGGEDENDNG